MRIKVEKLVFGGEALGETEDGKKALIWNALPGEVVDADLYKKKGTLFGAATEIVTASKDRVEPKEDHFLSCSPWQILSKEKEAEYKKEVIKELFERQFSIKLPKFELVDTEDYYHYRNKMEYSFYGDEDGLSLAFYKRGSRGKYKVDGCVLAKEGINKAAQAIVVALNTLEIRAGDLKSLVLRENAQGEVIAALFTKREDIPLPDRSRQEWYSNLHGFSIYYSDPRSPVSVPTKLIFQEGTPEFSEKILDIDFNVNALSFAQVNIPIFEKALLRIKEFADGAQRVVDFYAGSGAIGLSIAASEVVLVEENKEGVEAGNRLIEANNIKDAKFINAKAEDALEYLGKDLVIFDPPRSGLHPKIVKKLLEVLPEKIIYLSCNPATQGRDIAELSDNYDLEFFEGYNFFPRTPHVETLAVLKKK